MSYGKMHDFSIYRNTLERKIFDKIKIEADNGYQGIKKLHANSETPKKKPKGKELSEEEKEENKRIASSRMGIEHINAKIKVFKMMSNRYRNRRKRYHLRMNLICGIINYENYLL